MPGLDVTLLAPCYWPEVRRGGERLVHELATGLSAGGHRPRIVTAHRGWPSRRREDGVEVLRHWRPPGGGRLARRGFEDHLPHLPLALLSARLGGGDVVHALHVSSSWAAVRSGRPAVFTHLGIPVRATAVARRARLRLLSEAIAGCAVLTAVSRFAAAAGERELGGRWHAIPPAVDPRRFAPGGARATVPTAVCLADPREPRKRVGLLVEAWARVRRDRPDAVLVVCEGAPAAPGVEHVPLDADPAPLYRRAWCSVLPSRHEAFGLVLAEALACGTPAVGTDEGGIPEVVDAPELGVLVPPESDAGALARAVLEAFEIPGGEPCVAAAGRFAPERVTPRYVALYEQALGRA